MEHHVFSRISRGREELPGALQYKQHIYRRTLNLVTPGPGYVEGRERSDGCCNPIHSSMYAFLRWCCDDGVLPATTPSRFVHLPLPNAKRRLRTTVSDRLPQNDDQKDPKESRIAIVHQFSTITRNVRANSISKRNLYCAHSSRFLTPSYTTKRQNRLSPCAAEITLPVAPPWPNATKSHNNRYYRPSILQHLKVRCSSSQADSSWYGSTSKNTNRCATISGASQEFPCCLMIVSPSQRLLARLFLPGSCTEDFMI